MRWFKSPLGRIQDRLATKLLAAVFSIYFLITLTVTIVHVVAEYFETQRVIHHDLEGYYEAFYPGLAHALWGLDHLQIRSTIDGMMKITSIVGVKLVNENGDLIQGHGRYHDDNDQTRQRDSYLFGFKAPLYYEGQDVQTRVKLGEITIYSSEHVVFSRVKLGILFILFNSIIKTIALWIIFLYFARHILTRPLTLLTNATRKLSLENLENLNIDINSSGNHELKQLQNAFQQMVHKLCSDKHRMISLREFSNQIATFKKESRIIQAAFEVMCRHTNVSAGTLWVGWQDGRFKHCQVLPSTLRLDDPLHSQLLDKMLFSGMAEIITMNALSASAALTLFQAKTNHQIQPGHYLFAGDHFQSPHLIVLYRKPEQEEFDSADQEYVKSMLSQVESARNSLNSIRESTRMESELKTAAAVQHSLMPKTLPQVPQLELAAYFQSATETGGDWYGFIHTIKDHFYFLIGDVTGHGTPAALVTATASSACKFFEDLYLQKYMHEGLTPLPSEFLFMLNRAIHSAGYPDFQMTFFAARFNLTSGELVFSNAGHNFPLWLSANGELRSLLNANNRLGDRLHNTYVDSTAQLQQGDLLLFFTDGLIENENSQGEMYGERRLKRFLKQHPDSTAHEVLDQLIEAVLEFHEDHPLKDDITAVTCKIVLPLQGS